MAGKFNFLFLCLMFFILLITGQNVMKDNIDKETYFSYFEMVNVFVQRNHLFSGRHQAALLFNASDVSYHFDIVLQMPSFLDQTLLVNVNDNYRVPLSSFDNEVMLYEGTMTSRECRYTSHIKVTYEGLDAVIFCGNKTFYLEPSSRYIKTEIGEKENRSKGMFPYLHYQCIFYKSSDVKISGITWEGRANITKVVDDIEGITRGRYKRETRSDLQTECTLHTVADYKFYTSTGNSDIPTTIAELSYMILQANLIFRGTDFDGDGSGDNIGFYVTNITIYTQPQSYYMASAMSVESYLEKFSEYDFSDYCLATSFTSQNFENGVIGLAWMGSSSIHGPSGGICQHRILYKSKRMCLNTNLITNINEDRRMPAYISSLTLAHEFGHSFGSPHDDLNDATCTPAGNYGNYLMYPYASEGGKPNNNIFSSCSLNYMYPVIRNKGTCFQETVVSVCGNGLREGNEECDCGTNVTCASVDPCCTPSDVSDLEPDHPCTFRRSHGSRCSAKSICCTGDCKIVASSANKICKDKTECTEQSLCDGMSSICPTEVKLPDKIPCASGTKSCRDGMCIGSICATINESPCSCLHENTCYTCCLNSHSECSPYKNDNNERLTLKRGVSCNAKHGFCNGNGECISVDETSTMDRLKRVFTNEEVDSVSRWLKNQWYYVILVVVAILSLILLFVKTCRKDRTVQTSAYMYGRLTGIEREAELQKVYLQRRRREMKERYLKKIDKTENFSLVIDFPTAIARMMVFFPTAPMNVIVRTLKSSSSEESAVRWLLLRNYPFRRFCKNLESKQACVKL